jgi:Ni/Co efflux regulator RcnB
MKKYFSILAALILAGASVATAQDRGQRDNQRQDQNNVQFSQHDQQVAHDWYNQHQARPPAGFRNQDRLSADQESRLREGAPLDKDLRKRVHPAPPDLYRQLPPPPARHRYVAVGGHVALVDPSFTVKAVIHLH